MCLCGVGMTNGDQPTGNFLCQFPCAHSNPFVYGGKKITKPVVCGLQFFSHRFDCLHVLDP